MLYNYESLQNGSDIRGVALDIVEGESVNLDSQAVERLAKGFAYLLTIKTDKDSSELRISVGHDSRLSGKSLSNSIANALSCCGVKVISVGLASTPAMFMSTVFLNYTCDGAIMVTASHLPKNRNGMKFFTAKGGTEKNDITDIITFAESNSILARLNSKKGSISHMCLMDDYSAHLRDIISSELGNSDRPLKDLSITVDAGNGAGGFFAHDVLAPLGADISSSQFLEPDGNFPNHTPNPEDKKAMYSICERVKESQSDLGLIFDTDVDRVSAVDEHGKQINRNSIVALAASLLPKEAKGSTVVTDSITSCELTRFLEDSLGLKHLRFKRGYRNVINKSIELNESGTNSFLAIETSGHAAYSDNYFLDDGAYLAAKIVTKVATLKREGKSVSSMISNLKEPEESIEFRIPITAHNFSETASDVIDDLTRLISAGKVENLTLELPNYEGIRVNYIESNKRGWFLLRKSLHDPVMPLNLESNSKGVCDLILKKLKPLLEKYRELDLSQL